MEKNDLKIILEEIQDSIKLLSEKQNNQYTDLSLKLTNLNQLIESFGPDFSSMNDNDVEMYDLAKAAVIKSKKASTSWLQRKLGVGYSRAARLIDLLEDNEVISPVNEKGVRRVL